MGENLGQHFLQDKEVLADIITAGRISNTGTILEVGPGKGVLTEKLLEKAEKVIAVEKDPTLVTELEDKFPQAITAGQLELVQADIRDIRIADLITDDYKLIANIPYYLTGQLMQLTLTDKHQPKRMVLLLQREVAERIIAEDGKESRLSLSVKAFGEPEIIRRVPPESFDPAPEVDSAVLAVKSISRDFFLHTSEADFFALIKRGFSHKRKKLSNNLATSPKFTKDEVETALDECNKNVNIRAEKLSISDWRYLLLTLHK